MQVDIFAHVPHSKIFPTQYQQNQTFLPTGRCYHSYTMTKRTGFGWSEKSNKPPWYFIFLGRELFVWGGGMWRLHRPSSSQRYFILQVVSWTFGQSGNLWSVSKTCTQRQLLLHAKWHAYLPKFIFGRNPRKHNAFAGGRLC